MVIKHKEETRTLTDLIPTNGRAIAKIKPMELQDIAGALREFSENHTKALDLVAEKHQIALSKTTKGEAEAIFDHQSQLVIQPGELFSITTTSRSEMRKDAR